MPATNKQSLDFERPLLDLEKQLDVLMQSSANSDMDFTDEIKAIEKKIEHTKRQVYSDLALGKKSSSLGIPTVRIRPILSSVSFLGLKNFTVIGYLKMTMH